MPEPAAHREDKWRVAAGSPPADELTRVLKHDETFAIYDRYGDIQNAGLGEEGLYHQDTRFVSRQTLAIDGVRPMFLSSTVKDNNSLLIVEAMNPDLYRDGRVAIPKGSLHVFRARLLWSPACCEHTRIVNHGMEPIRARLTLTFGADYADIFQVRGTVREKTGAMLAPEVSAACLTLGYRGLDGVRRRTRIGFDPEPARIGADGAEFDLVLGPGAEAHYYVNICCEVEGASPPASPASNYLDALQRSTAAIASALNGHCKITSSSDLFNAWADRSTSDLLMLTTRLPEGPYPYAGVPWFATEFGRDGIITAREYLWVDPSLARGVLRHLAATQATAHDPANDAEPGKILHEARRGEMAAMHEIPFGRYYGTIDATPLFVSLAGAYHERTGDLDLIRELWPNICAALQWMDRHGDLDGDGFVEYARRSAEGLEQQGWKDSRDSVFHRDGRLARAPIALCEVQGYVYEAKRRASRLAHRLGHVALGLELDEAARTLRQRFNAAFWCEELGSYAIALDGEKRPCVVAASNAGHCLWSGIAERRHAAAIAPLLLGGNFYSGWGVRTIASDQARYNPMSYHNGSVWPHDNALIASGLADYGYTELAMTIFEGLYAASSYADQHRLPELFCGFPRRAAEGPTLYPVACSPQAWAAASVFCLLQACLGLSFDLDRPAVQFRNPRLPTFLEWVELRGLKVGEASLDLMLERYPNNVGVNVLRKAGEVEVLVSA